MNNITILKNIEILSTIFYKLVYMSIKAMIVIAIVFIALKIFKNRIRPKYKYVIGIMLILMLMIPIEINSKYNVIPKFNFGITENLDYLYNTSYTENYFIRNLDDNNPWNDNIDVESSDKMYEESVLENTLDFNFVSILKYIVPIIWIISVIIISGILIITNIIFLRRTRKLISYDERILKILENCEKKLNIKVNLKVCIGKCIDVPSIWGRLFPRLLLPETVHILTDKELEYIVYHELTHYKRKDNWLLLLIVILQTLYVFNPIIFIELNVIKDFMEYAVDEKVVAYFNTEEDIDKYCTTLIRLSTNNPNSKLFSNAFSDCKKILRKRMKIIRNDASKFKIKYVIICLTVLVLISIGIYAKSNNFSLDEIKLIIDKSFLNEKFIKVNVKDSPDLVEIFEEYSYENSKSFYVKNNEFKISMLAWFNEVNNKNLFYKHLRTEKYNTKECAVVSIYSKTPENFTSNDLWIDIKTGEILRLEFYYNRENTLKPSEPVTVSEYTYLDSIPEN